MEEQTRITLQRLKLRLPHLSNLVASLSGGQRQAVAIARAIHFNAKVLIMDEPTAALGPEETHKVGALISELVAARHRHHPDQPRHQRRFRSGERLAVMKNGRLVGDGADRGCHQGRRARHDHRRQAAQRMADVTIDAHVHLWRSESRRQCRAQFRRWRRSTWIASLQT